jgi:hypothetical protein
MGLLKDIGLVSVDNDTSKTFESILQGKSFLQVEYSKPSEYVKTYWNAFQRKYVNRNLGGKYFEVVIETLFLREGLMPLYSQAKVAFVPNVDFDVLLYFTNKGNENIPISISIKTSLRERYKQADLEGFALKNVHRRARCFLLTMDSDAAKNVNRKITTGDVSGLDRVYVCDTDEFDEFIDALKEKTYIESDTRKVITSTFEVTEEKYKKVLDKYKAIDNML